MLKPKTFKVLKRTKALIEAAARDPFSGIGKLEGLLGSLSGYWSRRIYQTNRLACRATDDALVVVGCRYKYAV